MCAGLKVTKYRPALALLCGVQLIQHPEKAKAPHRGECEAFKTALIRGEGRLGRNAVGEYSA
jgi:hypothetical protein